MPRDPVLALASQIDAAAMRFDEAAATCDQPAAQAAADQIEHLCARLLAARPVTPEGAAVRLGLACNEFEWSENAEALTIRQRLVRIRKRLSRGWQWARDIRYLEFLASSTNLPERLGVSPQAIEHIRAARAGLAEGRVFALPFGR